MIALKSCVAGTWLNALNTFGITQTLAQLRLCCEAAKEAAELAHSDWTHLIVGCWGFLSFSSDFTVFLLSRLCISRGGNAGLGKIPRAQRRKGRLCSAAL